MSSNEILKERVRRVATVFAGRADLGFHSQKDLEDLIEDELGSLDVFDGWVSRKKGAVRAVAPQRIYHVLASNLSVSAETSLVLGLLLGSELLFKLPGTGLPEFEATVEGLPADLKARVKLLRSFDESEMKVCEAVVVYGSNETVDLFRAKLGRRQRALFYGHRISLGILETGLKDLPGWAERAAREVGAYDQQGCLSPQFYLMENAAEAATFADLLAGSLRKGAVGLPGKKPGFEEASQRRHARGIMRARGAKVWESDEDGGFTVGLLSGSDFFVGPGDRFVQVGVAPDLASALRGWKGQVSSLSLATAVWPATSDLWFDLARELGASRLCRMGDLQSPPIAWRHDGRPRLADLVEWISLDS